MKANAKEYLKEFATSQSDWLKALIYEAIETNGNISHEKLETVFEHLINGTSLSITEPNINTELSESSESRIYITELIHKTGVNALKENQHIKFTDDVTILYGLNGTGKSSYFKVLNEIAGGNTRKNILSNIHIETKKSIEVELSFKTEGQSETIDWKGKPRSIAPLNKCKVFDTSYLNDLLEKREADSTLIQPLSLHLFKYLAGLMDGFNTKIADKAKEKRSEKPILEPTYFREEIKSLFEDHTISNETKKIIECRYSFSQEDALKLSNAKKELSNLKQVNIQDKISLINSKKNELEQIKEHIDNTYTKISNLIQEATGLLELYSANKTANRLAKEQFDILKSIPESNSAEWKEFIKAGEIYSSKLNTSKDTCAYCRQPLAGDSIQLVKAYGNFLRDESESKLNTTIQNIETLKNKLERLSIQYTIKENIKEILTSTEVESSNQTLSQLIADTNTSFGDIKNKLLKMLKDKTANADTPKVYDTKVLSGKLSSIISKMKEEVDQLSADDKKKKESVEKLENEIKTLLENDSISKQKNSIKKWFEINSDEENLKNKAKKINTNSVSRLSKKVHSILITENLKNNFSTELSNLLEYNNLDVSIENANSKKGTSSTKLILTKNNNITEILSDGEQKAVGLALFLAEVKIKKSKDPIILDDPVNSLDHKIAANFAKSLLKLENQIILFTHNRLFLDAFRGVQNSHICKTINTHCGKEHKHIYIYQVNSEGKNSKGALMPYKQNKAETHIKTAQCYLNILPFKNFTEVASLIRKTVECCIDEKIFNEQVPTKYTGNKSNINWAGLNNVGCDSNTIDNLKRIHHRASAVIHNGIEDQENPIEREEFKEMIKTLEEILNMTANNQ